MGQVGATQIIIILAVVLLLFGGKKIPELKYLSTYGGRIMFGPKKNIFSSSKIIKSNKKYL